jgi:hypothetical protein
VRLLRPGQQPAAPVQVFITGDAKHCGLELERPKGGRERIDMVPGGMRCQSGPTEHPSLRPGLTEWEFRRLIDKLDLLRDRMEQGYNIPFGFDLREGFGPEMQLPRGKGGWSCAIFVHRAFEAAGLPLVDLHSYTLAKPDRVSRDVADQRSLLKRSDDRHGLRGAIPRPTEVVAAAAASSADRPLDLARAEAAGRELEALLQALALPN